MKVKDLIAQLQLVNVEKEVRVVLFKKSDPTEAASVDEAVGVQEFDDYAAIVRDI